MSRSWEGRPDGSGLRVAVVVARFNQEITSRLLEGALRALLEHGVAEEHIEVVWVPGSFELPLALDGIARTRRFGAAVVLGAVVRGETPHFEYVAAAAARGISQVALRHGLATGFGVLTTGSWEQAEERVGGRHGHKGEEAALVALEMADLLRRLRAPEPEPDPGPRRPLRSGGRGKSD